LEFDDNGRLNYKKAVNMFYSLSDLNKGGKKPKAAQTSISKPPQLSPNIK